MVRQRPRKSVEELYASKLEANPVKSAVNSGINNKQAGRTDRDYGGYIISSTTPYNTPCVSSGLQTSRRKTARLPPARTEKYCVKEEKVHHEDVKKDSNLKPKTARLEKNAYVGNNMFDNKSFVNFSDTVQKDSNHGHHGHRHHDDDKDDDTEEFFELIRQTVENAIGKSISDLLNRNFRELSAKIDRFSAELKSTNLHLNKLQTDINNKVVHYGEENSRHFRYLCMKSEYDKMFYQHHTMLASSPTGEKHSYLPKMGIPPPDVDKPTNPRPCSNSRKAQQEPHKTSSEEHCMSQKSSELGMREVLEHIQRFCTQMQLNELKCDDRLPKSNYRMDEGMKNIKQVFEEDDDDLEMSSDGMTPRSDEHVPHKFGSSTMRSCTTNRGGNGGGDA